ncbi:MAG: SIMPL domain-containing protein [Bacteroidales bacterium]|nr:SIMPL domain-containing protein [Bacteroidales bacterium]
MSENQVTSKKSIIIGISLVVAAFVLGLMMIFTVKTLKSFDDTVSVRGLCEREVPADRVAYRISYSEKANTLSEARSLIDHHSKAIIAKLKEAGIEDSEIFIGNPSMDDRYSWSNDISRITYRYNAGQSINVYTSKMDVVTKLQNTLEADMLKEDILVNGYADYQFLGLNEIKPDMIAESLVKARESAEEFAKNSHSKIGKMRTASQGYFEVNDLDETTPQMKKVRVVTTVEYYLK